MIRKMQLNDARQVADIHTRAWQVAYQGIIDQKILDDIDITQREAMWRDQLILNETRTNLVYENNGMIQGWAAFGECEEEPISQELIGIYVDPLMFRRDIGSKLWHETNRLMLLNGPENLVLWVLNDNTQARRFYEKMGFVADQRERKIEWLGNATEVRYTKQA